MVQGRLKSGPFFFSESKNRIKTTVKYKFLSTATKNYKERWKNMPNSYLISCESKICDVVSLKENGQWPKCMMVIMAAGQHNCGLTYWLLKWDASRFFWDNWFNISPLIMKWWYISNVISANIFDRNDRGRSYPE